MTRIAESAKQSFVFLSFFSTEEIKAFFVNRVPGFFASRTLFTASVSVIGFRAIQFLHSLHRLYSIKRIIPSENIFYSHYLHKLKKLPPKWKLVINFYT